MLFDLRGRGRRNTIRVIYVSLAILMGGGLVLFGIGGATSGGLVDAITGSDGGGDTGTDRYVNQERNALARIKANPDDRKAYEDLITARVQLAASDGHYDDQTNAYDEEGLGYLRKAVETWKQYEQLKVPTDADKGSTANRIAGALSYLDQPEELISALEIVAESREATGPYQQLAVAAYQLGQTRKGDLAAEKAIELAPEDLKATVRSDMEQYKDAAATAEASATPGSAEQSIPVEPQETPSPKGKTGK